MPVKEIHGKQKQQKRMSTYFEFCEAVNGVLLCTDVAQRGLDFPDVDWIIQYDPPDDPDDYIHRVGRTARGANAKGKALLFLTKNEVGILRYLKKKKVALSEYEFPKSKLIDISDQYIKLIQKNYFLNGEAKDAYKSFLLSYSAHKLKDVYNVKQLNLLDVCKAFGLEYPPKVDLNISLRTR